MHGLRSLFHEIVDDLGAELEPLLLNGRRRPAVELLLPCLHHIRRPILHALPDISLELSARLLREIALEAIVVVTASVQYDTVEVVFGQVGQ